jgi:hypothetical protein
MRESKISPIEDVSKGAPYNKLSASRRRKIKQAVGNCSVSESDAVTGKRGDKSGQSLLVSFSSTFYNPQDILDSILNEKIQRSAQEGVVRKIAFEPTSIVIPESQRQLALRGQIIRDIRRIKYPVPGFLRGTLKNYGRQPGKMSQKVVDICLRILKEREDNNKPSASCEEGKAK